MVQRYFQVNKITNTDTVLKEHNSIFPSQVTPVVPMATETWSVSFAKYLELRFHGDAYKRHGAGDSRCGHSLHQDHFQYFGFKDIVASFK